jgi:SAM-dependent methyltransferase
MNRYMVRENYAEILECPELPEQLLKEAYRDMARIHGWLGDTAALIRAIRSSPFPVRRILDVGCGAGFILEQVGQKLGVEVVGVDLRPLSSISAPVPILLADAVRDPLPSVDVAFSMCLCHHLDEGELELLIRNAGRYCRRFICLDLVRHPLPLALFRLFVAPLICAIDAVDGQRSIHRAYTPEEMRHIVGRATAETRSTFSVSVAPFYVRQVVDITY